MNLDKALVIACQAHNGQVDKGGDPYILHPLRLMNQFDDFDLKIISVLHDVVEDTDVALADLAAAGFSQSVLSALDCLTKRQNETYTEFIKRVCGNRIASVVKMADIKDNLNISRLRRPPDASDFARIEKYHKALMEIEKALMML